MINKRNVLKVVAIIALVLGLVLYLKPNKEEEENPEELDIKENEA